MRNGSHPYLLHLLQTNSGPLGSQPELPLAELVELAPDVILASGGSIVGPLLQATSTVPIVFTQTPDPVGAGFVESLARPGGNATGFSIFDYSLGGKWVGLLKEVGQVVTRGAVLWDRSAAR